MNFNDQGVVGFDVSTYQDAATTPQHIDFEKMASYGADFVIIRAGQNLWVDPDFVHSWRLAREAGLPRGAYWFYDPRVSPFNQADVFSNLFASDKPEGRLWIDLEFPDDWGGDYANWRYWKSFIERVRILTGLPIGIYTASWWWAPHAVAMGADLGYFGQFPLWVAQYNVTAADVILPKGWMKAMIWQDGTPAIGKQVGVESEEIDHNKWNSDFSFEAEWGIQPTVPLEPIGETMPRFEATNLYPNMSLRTGHDTGANLIKTFPVGCKWHGDEVWTAPADKWIGTIQVNKAGDQWLHVTDIEGVLYSGWVAVTHLGKKYCELVDNNPPVETGKKAFTLQVEGYKPYSGELEPA